MNVTLIIRLRPGEMLQIFLKLINNRVYIYQILLVLQTGASTPSGFNRVSAKPLNYFILTLIEALSFGLACSAIQIYYKMQE